MLLACRWSSSSFSATLDSSLMLYWSDDLPRLNSFSATAWSSLRVRITEQTQTVCVNWYWFTAIWSTNHLNWFPIGQTFLNHLTATVSSLLNEEFVPEICQNHLLTKCLIYSDVRVSISFSNLTTPLPDLQFHLDSVYWHFLQLQMLGDSYWTNLMQL